MSTLRRDYRYIVDRVDPPADAPLKPPQAVYVMTPAGRLWAPYLLIATVVIVLLTAWGFSDQINLASEAVSR